MKRASWLFLLPVFFASLFATPQAQAQQRRGWSPEAKGATIGGAAGLLGGALINGRNRKVGGLIGGLAGAGAGYAVGKHIDNKHKKAAALAAERAAAHERLAAADARAAAAERAATAERKSVASSPGSIARVAGATTVAAAAGATQQGFASSPASPVVAAGYLPNTQYGVAGTAYPASEVRRKSW